jgi:hypothetical protein
MENRMPTGPWRKGSRSNGSGGNNCVEIAPTDGGVLLRDTKDRSKPPFFFTTEEWDAFTHGVEDGEFNF